jgi:hypothetical protein
MWVAASSQGIIGLFCFYDIDISDYKIDSQINGNPVYICLLWCTASLRERGAFMPPAHNGHGRCSVWKEDELLAAVHANPMCQIPHETALPQNTEWKCCSHVTSSCIRHVVITGCRKLKDIPLEWSWMNGIMARCLIWVCVCVCVMSFSCSSIFHVHRWTVCSALTFWKIQILLNLLFWQRNEMKA